LASVVPHPHLQAFQHSVDASSAQSHSLDASSGQSDTTSSSSAPSERSHSAAATSLLTSDTDSPDLIMAAVKAEPTKECPLNSLQPEPVFETVGDELQSSGSAVQAATAAAVTLQAQAGNDSLQNKHRSHKKRKAADLYTAASRGCTTDIGCPSTDIDDLPNAPGQQAGEPDVVQSEHRHCHARMAECAIDTTAASDLPTASTADAAVHSASTECRMSFHLSAVQLLATAVADSLDTDNKTGQMSTGMLLCSYIPLPSDLVPSAMSRPCSRM